MMVPAYGSISIVYNLRIAETSKRFTVASMFPRPSLGTCTLFGTFREKYDGSTQRCGGGLFTLIYAPEMFFLRVDGAVGHIASNSQGIRFSRAQTDDLLFSAGYSPKIADEVRITFSGLLGIPTHKDTSLEYAQFGYGHCGLGAQMDGVIACSTAKDKTIRCAARFIHFFQRKTCALVDTSLEQFKYALGNLVDLFIAFHYRRTGHSLEAGYNPSFFFDAHICPDYDDVVEKTDYIRNNFYGSYRYRFLINQRTHMIAAALSYGFDARPKTYGNKHIITVWASWSINF